MELDFGSFVLAAATADLADEPAARERADAIEFRMDRADDPLDTLAAYDGALPVLATNRAAREGGDATGDGRLEDLAAAAAFDAVRAIDVELESLRRGDADEAVARAREHGASVIASSHDFEGTPSAEAMRERLEAASERADVAKLAVTAREPGDVLALLSVTHDLAREERRVATMAMGEAGRHSRAVAPIYGSKIGYAPVDPDRATAPGQYDLETLAKLIERLR